jgi:hypothetical protein
MVTFADAVATSGITAIMFPPCAVPEGWTIQTLKLELPNNISLTDFQAIYADDAGLILSVPDRRPHRVPLVKIANGSLPPDDPLAALLTETEYPPVDSFIALIRWPRGLRLTQPARLRFWLSTAKAKRRAR